jgi:cytochrome P450
MKGTDLSSAEATLDFAFAPLPGQALHDHLAARRAEGPVVRVRFLRHDAWAILGHAELAEAFKDGERFPPHVPYRIGIEPVVGRNFQTMEGAEHRLYRRLATPAFRSRAVASYERSGMAELAHELIDRFVTTQVGSDGSVREADLATGFTHLYPFLVISRLLGVPRDEEEQFHRWAVELLSYPTAPERSAAASRDLTDYLAPVLEDRRRSPRNDVISELANAEADGRRLRDEEIFSHAKLLFAAGATTTHDALGSLLYALLTTPGAWKRICEDPAARAGAIEELLRWESPVALLPRMSAAQPIRFGGVEIPGNTFVLFGITAANRDPAVFPNPHRFDIERRSDRMLTFGPGLRSCPGMHLARKSIAVALDTLAERLPGLRLLDPQAARPQGAIIRGPRLLRVAF